MGLVNHGKNRLFLRRLSYTLAALAWMATTVLPAEPPKKGIPVILDTDIGDDIDDTWALALLLKCPELDVKLVATDNGKGLYRAKLLAKLLTVAGRTEIPIGIGHGQRDGTGPQQKWIKDYNLDSYPGTVHEDGAQAVIDTIQASQGPITLIAIGPVPNLAEVLRRNPRIADGVRFVGMHGAVRKGYNGSAEVTPEYNVKQDVPACQAVFTAPWEITITPLDTCGIVTLHGDKYARILNSDDPLLQAVIENYTLWATQAEWYADQKERVRQQTSILFDTVAIYLAISEDLCQMEVLPIRVTDEGMTILDEGAKKMRVATNWNDLAAFEDWLVARMTNTR
jgi:inosine-uridine nucleoside N-ribohydrolase